MPYFNVHQIAELKEYLYYQYSIHDAKITGYTYSRKDRILRIETANNIFNTTISLTFNYVSYISTLLRNENGSFETIHSLTVEEDLPCDLGFKNNANGCCPDTLCLLFQMFSGDELYVVAQSVLIEVRI